jgi:hypothetical protein
MSAMEGTAFVSWRAATQDGDFNKRRIILSISSLDIPFASKFVLYVTANECYSFVF